MLSNLGTQSTSIAYPLLVLAITHSAAKAGFVAFARTLPVALLLLPAGVAADHWSRKRLMVGADVVRVVAIGSLAAALLAHRLAFWAIPVVAFVEGAGAAVFTAAQAGALRGVVPAQQLPAAAGAQTGRQAAVQLAGPPIGGALFGLDRAFPFLADVLSYAFSTLSLLAMRTPFQQSRERDASPLRERVAEGFRFLWAQPFLRTCAFLFGLGNFIGPGVLLAIVVIARRQGLSAAAIGALTAVFGGCVLIGSFLSPVLRRLLPVRTILLVELWMGVAVAAFVFRPSVYVLTAGLVPTALVIPSTDSVVHGYRIAMTPDRLLGRVESVRATISLSIAPLGPLIAGFLLGAVSARVTIAVFAAVALVLALWGTLSPSIRKAPSLDTLASDETQSADEGLDTDEVQAMALDLSALWSDEARAVYGEPSDVHPEIAARLDAENPGTVLDIGCGTGVLGNSLRSNWIGIDRSIEQLRQSAGRTAISAALSLPFADDTFGAAATLYTLYFFADPSAVAAEARRVLRPGALFAVCAPSRHDDPEIAHFGPRDDVDAFASEDIEELLTEQFVDVEIHEWNFPYLELRDVESARDYIHFWYYPRLSRSEAEECAKTLALPQKITKIGAWGVGRKPRWL